MTGRSLSTSCMDDVEGCLAGVDVVSAQLDALLLIDGGVGIVHVVEAPLVAGLIRRENQAIIRVEAAVVMNLADLELSRQ